jgi:hypothetical protein
MLARAGARAVWGLEAAVRDAAAAGSIAGCGLGQTVSLSRPFPGDHWGTGGRMRPPRAIARP